LSFVESTLIPLALTTIIADANDPRHVIIKELRIICNGRPGGDIVYPLTSKKDLEKMASGGFVLKVDRCKRPARPPARPLGCVGATELRFRNRTHARMLLSSCTRAFSLRYPVSDLAGNRDAAAEMRVLLPRQAQLD
jgi:hypothetical protein